MTWSFWLSGVILTAEGFLPARDQAIAGPKWDTQIPDYLFENIGINPILDKVNGRQFLPDG